MEEVLAYFGGDTARGRRRYEEFVMEGISGQAGSPLEKGRGHGIIGGDEFIERVKRRYLRLGDSSREVPAVRKILAQVEAKRIVEAICEEFKVKREEILRSGYKGLGRGVLMEMLYRYGGMKQREIGRWMGIDYSAVSVMRKRFSVRMEKNRKLSGRFARIKEQLQQSQE